MMSDGTQFSVQADVKNELDRFKAEWKQEILTKYRKKKRFVTNTDAIRYLLDTHKENAGKVAQKRRKV